MSRPKLWWTQEEHDVFRELFSIYGNNWKQYEAGLPNRTVIQIRSHAQKYFLALNRDSNYQMYSGKKCRTKSSKSTAYLPIMKKFYQQGKKISKEVSSKKVSSKEVSSKEDDMSDITIDSSIFYQDDELQSELEDLSELQSELEDLSELQFELEDLSD